jgi:hypothetical protein
MLPVSLAATLHNPEGSMLSQAVHVLPTLTALFPAIAIRASAATHTGLVQVLRNAGALVDNRPAAAADGQKLGLARREAVALALADSPSFILYCDLDRALHWAEHYPAELADTCRRLQDFDFTVLGRTARAFLTHPRVQRDTEAIINHVFMLVSGLDWDVGAGARGLSGAAARAVLDGCHDENLSTDVSWPLYLRSQTGFRLGSILSEGLEFETQDRYSVQVEAAGGLQAWLDQFDADPQRWLERLELAGSHLRAMQPFASQ